MGHIAYLIGQALGFSHQEQRPDRDLYLTVESRNLMPFYGEKVNIKYDKWSPSVPFDYNSLMTRKTKVKLKKFMYQYTFSIGGHFCFAIQMFRCLYKSTDNTLVLFLLLWYAWLLSNVFKSIYLSFTYYLQIIIAPLP